MRGARVVLAAAHLYSGPRHTAGCATAGTSARTVILSTTVLPLRAAARSPTDWSMRLNLTSRFVLVRQAAIRESILQSDYRRRSFAVPDRIENYASEFAAIHAS